MTVLESRKWKKAEYAGQTVNMPVLGNVTFEKNGRLNVEDDDLVGQFVALTTESFDFVVVGAQNNKDASKGKEKATESKLTEDQVEAKKKADEAAKIKEDLDKMDLKQLAELIKETDINPDTAVGWTDKRLRKELLKKLTA